MEENGAPKAAAIAQLRKGVAPYCVLALVAGHPQYGYGLARALADAGVVAGAGSVYPLLSRLQAEGWLRAQWRTEEAGAPRKYYRLTPAGSRALADFQDLWRQFAQDMSRILEAGGGGDGEQDA